MKSINGVALGLMSLSIGLFSASTYADNKSLVKFSETPTAENLFIKKTKDAKRAESMCIGSYALAFNLQTVTGASTGAGLSRVSKGSGIRLIDVPQETRQEITDESFAYLQSKLKESGIKLLSDAECAALKGWSDLKTADDALGVMDEKSYLAKHIVSGRPDYLSFGVGGMKVFVQSSNNMMKSYRLSSKEKINLASFTFLLDFNAPSAEVDKGAYANTFAVGFEEGLHIPNSVVDFFDPKNKTIVWEVMPVNSDNFPSTMDKSFVKNVDKNSEVWNKAINLANYDISVDPQKYKEIYLKTLKVYIDVYVSEIAALKPL